MSKKNGNGRNGNGKKRPAKLTLKQKRWVKEYLVDLNATQAAIRAGYSENSAAQSGSLNKRNAVVQVALAKALARRETKTEVTAERVVLELARIAFADMRQYAEWGPEGVCLVSSEELSDDAAAAISEVSESVTKDGGRQSFRLHSKTKALELLMKHLGMSLEKHDVNVRGAGIVVHFTAPSNGREAETIEGETKDG